MGIEEKNAGGIQQPKAATRQSESGAQNSAPDSAARSQVESVAKPKDKVEDGSAGTRARAEPNPTGAEPETDEKGAPAPLQSDEMKSGQVDGQFVRWLGGPDLTLYKHYPLKDLLSAL